MVASFSNFCQHSKTLFLRVFILKPTERAWVLLKTVLEIFKNSPLCERLACFSVTISEIFKRFQYFKFEKIFLENENLFQKTGVPASFPFKTALSETNVKTNRMATTKWTYPIIKRGILFQF